MNLSDIKNGTDLCPAKVIVWTKQGFQLEIKLSDRLTLVRASPKVYRCSLRNWLDYYAVMKIMGGLKQ